MKRQRVLYTNVETLKKIETNTTKATTFVSTDVGLQQRCSCQICMRVTVGVPK